MEDLFKKLIETPTLTSNRQANAGLVKFIGDYLAKRGMHVKYYESNGYASLVATTRPGARHSKIMLAAHTDVTAAPPDMFKLQKRDGKYYGRGVMDMKFAIANFMQLSDDLKDRLADYDFSIVITSDEEIGGENGMLKILEAGYSADVCILPDGGANWQMERIAKGVDWFEIVTTGVTAHASVPWLGHSAAESMHHIISEIMELFPGQGPKTNTVNIGTLHSGEATNQVADKAVTTLDVRTISREDQVRIRQQIDKICAKHSATVKRAFENGDAVVTDQNNPFVVAFKKAVADVTGKTPGTKIANGSSDARYMAAKNILCIVVSPEAGDHHSDKEWLSVEGFGQYKHVLRRFLNDQAD